MNEEIHAEVKEEKKTSEEKAPEVTETTKSKPVGRFGKKQLRLIGATVVIVIAILMGIGICNSPTWHLTEKLELGQKYLEEMNYEEAVVVFNSVIEIDPMNADAYLGLVEVYIRTGDFDMALAYAEKGYEVTGDEHLKEKIDMIESGNITASNGWTMKESYYDYQHNYGLEAYFTYTYDMQGRRKSVNAYDKSGNLVTTGDYQYDENGHQIVGYDEGFSCKQQINEIADVTVYLKKYELDYDAESRCIGGRNYDELGDLTSRYEIDYDAEGRCIGLRAYDEFNILYEFLESDYDKEGRLIGERFYNGSGNLTMRSEYDYDEEGRLIGERLYDESDNLKSYSEYEYNAEGEKTGEKHYDSSGKLQSEKKYE